MIEEEKLIAIKEQAGIIINALMDENYTNNWDVMYRSASRIQVLATLELEKEKE